jgi:hypothetical protein
VINEGRWVSAAGGAGRGVGWAEWDLLGEKTGVSLRGVANSKMGSVVVRVQLR